MDENRLATHIGRRIWLPGHFDVPVILEGVRPLGSGGSSGYECRVRFPNGMLEETVISSEEASVVLGADHESSASAGRPRSRSSWPTGGR